MEILLIISCTGNKTMSSLKRIGTQLEKLQLEKIVKNVVCDDFKFRTV